MNLSPNLGPRLRCLGNQESEETSKVEGTYNLTLVSLSYVVAVAASYTALELSRRVSESSGTVATLWLVGGAFSMGVGIWTMHFVGMLAFSMPMPFSYDVLITVISLFVGMAAAAFAIFIASRKRNSLAKIALSGLLLGGGIAAMHYTGMAAMRMDAVISYDTTLVVLSIAIAVIAACAAIWIIFTLSTFENDNLPLLKLGAALIMGVAICGMHYTGMAAASYTPTDDVMHHVESGNNVWMAVTMGAVALVILGVTHLTIFFDYRLGVEKQHGKKAEQQAVQLSEILDESSNEIYFFDSITLRFVKVNRGAVNNLGYSETELHSMTPVDIKPEFTEAGFKELLEPLHSQSKKELLLETLHRRHDGSEYPVQIHLQLSQLTDPPMFVAIIMDITEQKKLESQLMQAQKLESIGQLAAGIAHEINTPTQYVGDNTRFVKDAFDDVGVLFETLTKLQASANGSVPTELLSEALKLADIDYLKDEVPRALEQSLEGVERVTKIVRAMKEFSHPSQEKTPVDLNAAIESTLTVASNEWKYVAELSTDFDTSLPMVSCLPGEFNQVILNIVVNAAHAIIDVVGDAPQEKGTMTLSTRKLDGWAEVCIADSGAGMPADVRSRVFDPFFTTKEVGKGTGQGLSIAYNVVVNKHGGTINVDSEPGQGTRFTIRLPLDDSAAAAADAAA